MIYLVLNEAISHFFVARVMGGASRESKWRCGEAYILASRPEKKTFQWGSCSVKLSWGNDFHYILASSEARKKASCKACDVHSSIGHSGKDDIKRHIERDCHRTKASALSRMGSEIARYIAAGTEVGRVTAAETMFANSIANSNLPLAITNDFSKIVLKMISDCNITKNQDHPDHQGRFCSRV